MPQARRPPIRVGSPSHAGVTISAVSDSPFPDRRYSRW